MRKMTEYLENIIGLKFTEVHTNSLPKEIPSIYRHSFVLRMMLIESVGVLMLEPREKSIELPSLVVRSEKLETIVGLPCVLVLDRIDSVLRRQLILKKRSFIVPGKQVFLPFIGTYLSERGMTTLSKKQATLSPSAQLLLLYHLLKDSLEGIPFGLIAEKLGYTQKTMSLIASELKDLGICSHLQIDSKTKSLQFGIKNRRELWDSVLPYLKSPIHKVLYVDTVEMKDLKACEAYDNALSFYTDIVDTPQRCYAADRKSVSLCNFTSSSSSNFMDAARLEVWKYDPFVLAKDRIIDPLSMYLCYRDDDSERVAGELNRLIDKVLW